MVGALLVIVGIINVLVGGLMMISPSSGDIAMALARAAVIGPAGPVLWVGGWLMIGLAMAVDELKRITWRLKDAGSAQASV